MGRRRSALGLVELFDTLDDNTKFKLITIGIIVLATAAGILLFNNRDYIFSNGENAHESAPSQVTTQELLLYLQDQGSLRIIDLTPDGSPIDASIFTNFQLSPPNVLVTNYPAYNPLDATVQNKETVVEIVGPNGNLIERFYAREPFEPYSMIGLQSRAPMENVLLYLEQYKFSE